MFVYGVLDVKKTIFLVFWDTDDLYPENVCSQELSGLKSGGRSGLKVCYLQLALWPWASCGTFLINTIIVSYLWDREAFFVAQR